MKIEISKDNKQYIEQLKERGFKEIHNKTRNKNMITLTDVDVSDHVLVESERRPFKTFYPNYSCDTYRECHHCHKLYYWKSLAQHIRNIHLK
jgi:hypothetical protein